MCFFLNPSKSITLTPCFFCFITEMSTFSCFSPLWWEQVLTLKHWSITRITTIPGKWQPGHCMLNKSFHFLLRLVTELSSVTRSIMLICSVKMQTCQPEKVIFSLPLCTHRWCKIPSASDQKHHLYAVDYTSMICWFAQNLPTFSFWQARPFFRICLSLPYNNTNSTFFFFTLTFVSTPWQVWLKLSVEKRATNHVISFFSFSYECIIFHQLNAFYVIFNLSAPVALQC